MKISNAYKQICMKLFSGVVVSMMFNNIILLAGSYGQNHKVEHLQFHNATAKSVFDAMNEKTGYNFLYDEQVISSVEERITLNEQIPVNIKRVLKEISKQTGFSFMRVNQNITVKWEEASMVHSSSPHKRESRALSSKPIRGTVRDAETGELLIGATVHVKGSTTGTVTDLNGNFELDIPDGANSLIISYVGYNPVELEIDNEAVLNIELIKDILSLNEIVVTGQGGAVSKRRLSNNVKTMKAKELSYIPSQRIDQLLSTKLPNAQLNLTGGQAGATSIIRVRGINSAFVNSTPIIYVDGIRMDNLNTRSQLGGGSAQGAAISSISDIPMDNIDRIEYINGGAATTLYGSDAANGVIQIFTKKGSRSGTQVTFESQLGVQTPTTDFLYFNRTKELLFENGTYQKYRMNISGGNNNGFGYSFAANYYNNSGVQIYKQNQNTKVDFSTGFKANIGEKINYESSFIYVNNKYKRNRNGNQGGYTGLWFTEDGASKLKGFDNRIDDLSDSAFVAMKTFVHKAEKLQDNHITVNRFTTSQTFKYRPVKDLIVKLTGGIDYRDQLDQVIYTNEYLSHTSQETITDEGSIENVNRTYLGITLELNAQHTYEFNSFSFITTMGGQLFRNQDHQILYEGSDIRDGAQTISDAAVVSSDEYLFEVLNYGIYLQENIGFKDKLFFDLGVRGDRNPSFGDNIGTQYYPKAGLSWMASSEDWFHVGLINSLRFRTNYGIAGNLPPAYANEKTISFDGFLEGQAAYFGQPGNDDLRPEKTHTFEIGADLSILKNRVSFSGGYYHSLTKDALFYVPSLPSSGYTEDQLKNVGEILNEGWELSASLIPVQKKDISLELNFSINTLYNEVVSSGGVAPFNINGFSSRTIQTVVEEGHPIGYLRGNYGTFDENGVLAETTAQSYLGTTIPDLFGNLGVNFRYKNLEVYANGNYQKGAYANSFDAQFRFYYGASDDIIPAGEIEANGRKNWLKFTNKFVEKTDFIKVRTMGIRYSIRPKNNAHIQLLTVGFSAINPLNFATSSFDPENTISGAAAGQGGATTGGISYATYSSPRLFLFNLSINL